MSVDLMDGKVENTPQNSNFLWRFGVPKNKPTSSLGIWCTDNIPNHYHNFDMLTMGQAPSSSKNIGL